MPEQQPQSPDLFALLRGDLFLSASMALDSQEQAQLASILGTKDLEQDIKRAATGDKESLLRLSFSYINGWGVPVDKALGLSYMEQVANLGDSNAQTFVAVLYEQGTGTAVDLKKAAFWYKAAATQGDPRAQNNLAAFYEQGLGVKRDLEQALYWYYQSARQGYPQAQYNMALCYETGMVVTPNSDTYHEWLCLAAASGSPEAKFTLALCYLLGRKGHSNIKLFQDLIKQNAEQGRAAPLLLLAFLLLVQQYNRRFARIKTFSELSPYLPSLGSMLSFLCNEQQQQKSSTALNPQTMQLGEVQAQPGQAKPQPEQAKLHPGQAKPQEPTPAPAASAATVRMEAGLLKNATPTELLNRAAQLVSHSCPYDQHFYQYMMQQRVTIFNLISEQLHRRCH